MSDALKYSIGQIVYAKIKPDVSGMVTAIVFRARGYSYWVTWSNDMSERSHDEVELTYEKSYVAKDE